MVASVFVLRAGAAILVIPRWQGPDEPQHFLLAASILRGLPSGAETVVTLPPAVEQAVGDLEATIIRSMAREGWWAYYGARTPGEPLPRRFVDGPNLITDVPGASGGSRVYFTATSGVSRLFGIAGIEREYDALRLVSAFWGLLTVVAAYGATRVWLNEDVSLAVAASLAFHPQFLLVSTTVSPDAFVNLCGALMWWQAGGALAGSLRALATMWLAALAAAITRRVGSPLLLIAAVMSASAVLRSPRRLRVGIAALGILVGCAIVLAALAALWPAEFARLVTNVSAVEAFVQPGRDRADLAVFSSILWESAWLSAGWVRFPAPAWWMAIVSTWALVASWGVVAETVSRRRRYSAICAAALAAVSIQTAAIFVVYWWIVGAGAQGRYLFPVVVPLMTLLVVGTETVMRTLSPRLALVLPVALVIALDVLAWTTVFVPVYAR